MNSLRGELCTLFAKTYSSISQTYTMRREQRHQYGFQVRDEG